MIEEPHHLVKEDIINKGSFYTPNKYVLMAGKWLSQIEDIDNSYTILDSSCGYGAFFNMSRLFPHNRYIGNDIDEEAVNVAKKNYPFVEFYTKNAFVNICRKQFGINNDDHLVIVGNPPYNDTTSQAHQSIKSERIEMDKDVISRDLGMSSLLSYNKLKADYVLVLHPLSYLIKKTNYLKAKAFFNNYTIINHIVFSSAEFANTSKNSCFPIIMALYKRNEGVGVSYKCVQNMRFCTKDDSFRIADWDYIGNYINKYPHKERYTPEILFYTLRDVNALKRSRTFIRERVANAVDVNPDMLGYYCYIDCFKRYAEVPYYLGNLDVPFIEKNFHKIEAIAIKISKYYHSEVFPGSEKPSDSDIITMKNYIAEVLKQNMKKGSDG